MALNGSIIVDVYDETMAKMWRKRGKPVESRVCLPACCSFSEFLLSYGDGDPSKPHLNVRGKHFLLLFCVICSCLWENCVPKIDLTRAIFSTLGDCFGTPLLWRFLLVSIDDATGKSSRFPFLDILGYLKDTHKNPKFGRVRQVPTRDLGWEFRGWDLSHFAKFGLFVGIL